MKKQYIVQLTDEQRSQLERLTSIGTHKARVLARARILLLADQHFTDERIAQLLSVGDSTVERVRKRFATHGLDLALYGIKQPGRPVRITGDVEAKLVMLACSSPPEGRARWTLQLLADKLVELKFLESISDQQVYKMLKKTNLSLGAKSSGASPRPTAAS